MGVFPHFSTKQNPDRSVGEWPVKKYLMLLLLSYRTRCDAMHGKKCFICTISFHWDKREINVNICSSSFFLHITPKMLIFRNVSNHREKISLQLSSLPPLPVLRQQADIMNAAAALRGPSGTQMAETDDFTRTFTGRTAGTFDKIIFHQVHSAHRRIPSHPRCSKALRCLGLKHSAKLCVHTHVQEVEIRQS